MRRSYGRARPHHLSLFRSALVHAIGSKVRHRNRGFQGVDSMKSSVLTSTAAAVLVAAFGALAAATPAAAQPSHNAPPRAVVVQRLQIDRVVMHQDGPLRPGSEVRFR